MKKSIFAILIFALALSANAQRVSDKLVPSAVKIMFQSMFPDVKKIKWEKENGKYEAEFNEKITEKSALFESDGTYVQTETEIPVSSLPPAIIDYVSKNLPGQNIDEASQITSAGGSVSYEAEIGKTDYLFDASGNFLKKQTDKNDTEENDK